jgi:microsomal epoxide hydrolase
MSWRGSPGASPMPRSVTPDDDAEWKYGADAAWLASLRDHWRDHYDWRSAEAAFNAHPQIAIPASGF